MTKKYTYWSNENGWHDHLLFEVEASSVLEADALFKEKTGQNPTQSKISVSISCLNQQVY